MDFAFVRIDEKSGACNDQELSFLFLFTQSVAEVWITREKSGNTTKPCFDVRYRGARVGGLCVRMIHCAH